MAQFNFILTEVPGTEQTVIMCSCKTPNPAPNDFKQARIDYSSLSPSEKVIYDKFEAMVKSKCK
jgi:hypothetical protein